MNYKTAILAGLMAFIFMSHATEPKPQASSSWSFSNSATWALGGLTAAMSAKCAHHYIMANRWYETYSDIIKKIAFYKKHNKHAEIKDIYLKAKFRKIKPEDLFSSDQTKAANAAKKFKSLLNSYNQNTHQRECAQKHINKIEPLQKQALNQLISEDIKHRQAFSYALMPALTLGALQLWQNSTRA